MTATAAARAAGEAAAAACPTLARFLARHPALSAPVADLLAAAATVRVTRDSALPAPAPPSPPASAAWHEHGQTVLAAVAALEGLAAGSASPPPAAVVAAARGVASAMLALRTASHAFGPPRAARDASARAALFAALDAWARAWRALNTAAAAAHVRRLPWQLDLATHVAPGTPMSRLCFDGYDLPRTRTAERSWGERCCLTGMSWTTDRRESPGLRYRSLDAAFHTLSPVAMELVERLRAALASLVRSCPQAEGELLALVRLFPFLAERHLPETASPGFQRLGLLDFPSQAVALNNVLLAFGSRPLFGVRGGAGVFPELGLAEPAAVLAAHPASAAGPEAPYRWTTYETVRERALRLAFTLERRGLSAGARLGIFAPAPCPEVHLADFAAIFGGLVSVVLPATASREALLELLARERVALLVAEAGAHAGLAASAEDRGATLPPTLVFGAAPGAGDGATTLETALAATEIPAGWRSASGIAATTGILFGDPDGRATAAAAGIAADSDDALYTLLWSSGSTREPAAIPVTRRRFVEEMCSEAGLWPLVGVSFQAPWAGADRGAVWRALTNGGRVGFARAGAALFADLEALRPTALDAPPVVWRALFAEYRRAVADPDLPPAAVAAARRRLRRRLGGRLAFASIGGAPSEGALRDELGRLLGVPLHDSYGTTETGNIGVDGRLAPGLDYRLLDVPELGLTSGDHPHGRGELAVRTHRSDAPADPERTTADGYVRTGDLVELLPARRFRVIGRRRHVLKLASGEWVAPEELEGAFATSPHVEAVLVVSSPLWERVVLVVVPVHPTATERELLAEFHRVARRESLRPSATPAAVVVVPRADRELPWRVDNGLLTATGKPNRAALEARYRAEAEAAYARSSAASDAAAIALGDSGSGQAGVLERLCRLAAALLACPLGEVDSARSLVELGGDSLAAMELELRLGELFGSAALAASQHAEALATLPLEELAQRLASPDTGRGDARGGTVARPAATEAAQGLAAQGLPAQGPAAQELARLAIEPAGAATVQEAPTAADLAELANRDAGEAVGPVTLPRPATSEDVLVTGANGFLGSHLVAHLASTLPSSTRIFALLRAPSHEAAAERLRAALLARELHAREVVPFGVAEGGVVAVAASLAEERLGLAPALYERLTCEVGLIHHVAAEVAFDRSYAELRAANVVGTRRVLELATEGTLKALHFVSSLNVLFLLRQLHPRGANEATPLPAAIEPAQVAGNLGYTISKWAAERLVEELFRRAGGAFRASISRPALLVWSTTTGIGNDDDWFGRALASCLQMRRLIGPDEVAVPRWAPETPLSARGLDLVPIDFAARALAHLGEQTRAGAWGTSVAEGVPTFHVSNTTPGEGGLVTGERLMDLLASSLVGRDGAPLDWRFLPLAEWALEAEAQGAPVLPVLNRLRQGWPRQERTPTARFAATYPEPCPPFDRRSVEAWCVARGRAGSRDGT